MTISIGSLKTQFGTNSNNSITGSSRDTITFGLAGNDTLTANDNIFAGGIGDDTYILPSGKSAGVFDSGGNDTVRLPFSSNGSSVIFYTIDNRHFAILDDTTRSGLFVFDWKNSNRKIENFVFSDFTLSYDYIVNNYTSAPGYRGNVSFQTSDPNGQAYLRD